MIEKRKNNIILFCITLLGSLAMLGAIRAIVEDKKDSDYKSYHQKLYEEYKQQRDSSYQHLTQIYGKEKVGLVIYSCICFENENINLDSLQMGYISDVYFNPRSRKGSDLTSFRTIQRQTLFQSTLPQGERHSFRRPFLCAIHISIHAPARGATWDRSQNMPK